MSGVLLVGVGCESKEEAAAPVTEAAGGTEGGTEGGGAGSKVTTASEAIGQMPRRVVEQGNAGMAMPKPPAGAAVAVAAGERYQGDGISWELPGGWSQRGASGMRYATLVPAAGPEVSVTRLGGGGGGMLANVNRWRGQVLLPPVTEEELGKLLKVVPLNGSAKASVVDCTGEKGRIVGALIPIEGGQTWFFKAQVEKPEQMEAILADFEKLVASVKIGG